jgi:PRTRC genetic system protein E
MLFKELFELARTGAFSMVLMADADKGVLTVHLAPYRPGKDAPPGLREPLTVRATPEELDAGFSAALTGYAETRATLAEQAAAAARMRSAASKPAAKKALPAPRTGPQIKLPASATPDSGQDDDRDDDRDDDEQESGATANQRASAASGAQPRRRRRAANSRICLVSTTSEAGHDYRDRTTAAHPFLQRGGTG